MCSAALIIVLSEHSTERFFFMARSPSSLKRTSAVGDTAAICHYWSSSSVSDRFWNAECLFYIGPVGTRTKFKPNVGSHAKNIRDRPDERQRTRSVDVDVLPRLVISDPEDSRTSSAITNVSGSDDLGIERRCATSVHFTGV